MTMSLDAVDVAFTSKSSSAIGKIAIMAIYTTPTHINFNLIAIYLQL